MLGNRLILIVDPSEDIRDMLIKAFTLEGYRVETCTKGVEALQEIYKGKVDAVVVDAEIVDIEIDRFVQASHRMAPQLPIVVITANMSAEFEKRVRKNRIFYYTTKPFSLEIMKTAIRDALKYKKNLPIWSVEELRHFRVITRSVVIDAIKVLDEIKSECQDRRGYKEAVEGKGPTAGSLPRCGWAELMEKLQLLERYLDHARMISEGKI